MKALFLFLAAVMVIGLGRAPCQSLAYRSEYTKRCTTFTTVAASTADTFRFSPNAAEYIVKHTTVAAATGAPTALLDSVAITLLPTYAKTDDVATVYLATAGTARKLKLYGTYISAATANLNTTVGTNKKVTLVFYYDGALWRNTLFSVTP